MMTQLVPWLVGVVVGALIARKLVNEKWNAAILAVSARWENERRNDAADSYALQGARQALLDVASVANKGEAQGRITRQRGATP